MNWYQIFHYFRWILMKTAEHQSGTRFMKTWIVYLFGFHEICIFSYATKLIEQSTESYWMRCRSRHNFFSKRSENESWNRLLNNISLVFVILEFTVKYMFWNLFQVQRDQLRVCTLSVNITVRADWISIPRMT